MLHIISGHNSDGSALDNCLQFLGDDDVLVFCGDGVDALRVENSQQKINSIAKTIAIYVLNKDLDARAIGSGDIEKLSPQPVSISIEDFALLVVQHSKSLSWF